MCKDICKEERKEERERGPKGKGEGYKDTGGRSNVSEVEYLLLIQPFLSLFWKNWSLILSWLFRFNTKIFGDVDKSSSS